MDHVTGWCAKQEKTEHNEQSCEQPELRKEEMSNLSKIKSNLEDSPLQREATNGHFSRRLKLRANYRTHKVSIITISTLPQRQPKVFK